VRAWVVLIVAGITLGACTPQPVTSPTFAPTPTPVPGSTLTPTATLPGAGLGDCAGMQISACEAIWTAAVAFGFDPKAASRIVRWTVQPTVVRSCGGSLKPRFDVVFELDSGPDLTVTVGERSDGRLLACTY
jgi:hypothetical protein